MPHPLSNFEMQEYYQNKPKFNGVYSRKRIYLQKNLKKYVINLDEYESIETHRIASYVITEDVYTLLVLRSNISQKKFKNSLKTKILQRIFTECKHVIQ